MKKLFTAAAAFLAAACFMSCGGKKENIVKIGVYEPASGDNGAGGKQETLGVQYANQITPTVTIGGKEYKVQLEIVDNESSNDKAVTAASELIHTVQVFQLQLLIHLQQQMFQLLESHVQTHRLQPAMTTISASASLTHSRDQYMQTWQKKNLMQKKLMHLLSLETTIL